MATPSVNPYIFEIEKHKKKQHLAHELGAGSPCSKCKEKCSGFDLHFWRKVCKNCRCGKEEHGVVEDDYVRIQHIGKLFGSETSANKCNLSENFSKNLNISSQKNNDQNENRQDEIVKYDWVPPHNDSTVVQKYMNQLPEEHKPISGSSGAIIRKKLLEKQLPVHDLDFNECHELSPGEINKMNEFVNKCKEHVGVGQIYEFKNQNISLNCTCCTNPLKYGDVVIFTKHSSNETFWHPQCFSCSKCNDRLVDLIYFHDKGEVFCGRHFAEISCDRCAACDELIFTDAYTKAEGKNWHIKHFCCYNCDKPLAGKNYVVSENGYPACVECLSKKCASCLGFIHVSMKRISLNNMHWHAANDCFKCSACHIPLLGDRFLIKDNFIFCSVNCKKVQYPN